MILEETARIKSVLSELGYDYVGGGPYPDGPANLTFFRGKKRLVVVVDKPPHDFGAVAMTENAFGQGEG